VEFLKYISEIEWEGEDVLLKLLILSLPSFLQDWSKGCCEDRGISSFVDLISRFPCAFLRRAQGQSRAYYSLLCSPRELGEEHEDEVGCIE
jgi:hypothetical protein